jgi:DNA-binding response OmpR family regulator
MGKRSYRQALRPGEWAPPALALADFDAQVRREKRNMKRRILVVDDDLQAVAALSAHLESANYDVTTVERGLEGLRIAYRLQPDLVILDLTLPDQDGWSICQRLREMSDVPIMTMSEGATKHDAVRALNAGADDHMPKPLRLDELLARIKALIRRAHWNARPLDASRTIPRLHSDLLLDAARHSVMIHGRDVELTPLEFRLLDTLHRHAGRVLPHHYLLLEVWGPQYSDRTNYLKLYIRYLREKIEDDPSNPRFVRTEWGVGYYLSES